MGFSLFFVTNEQFILRGQPQWFLGIFVFVYSLLIIFSNSYFAYTLSVKRAKANFLIAGICVVLIAIQNGIFYYLYSVEIFISEKDLFIIIPISWGIAFICVRIWILISSRRKLNI